MWKHLSYHFISPYTGTSHISPHAPHASHAYFFRTWCASLSLFPRFPTLHPPPPPPPLVSLRCRRDPPLIRLIRLIRQSGGEPGPGRQTNLAAPFPNQCISITTAVVLSRPARSRLAPTR